MAKILKPLIILLCLPLVQPAWGQTASLVADLGLTNGFEDSSHPGPFLSLQDKVFFPAREASSGAEMWVSDGTAAGTELLADACPGECSSGPQFLGTGSGGVFWAAEDSERQVLLWWSDGTRAGTRALRRNVLRIARRFGDDPAPFAFVRGVLYVQGCTPAGECNDLWRSDGAEAGTRPVLPTPRWESVSGLQAVGSTVFFIASEGSFSPGVWTTDGTEAGTRLVRSLDFFPRLTAATTDRFFFLLPTVDGGGAENGEALWVSDGTEAGTRQLVSFPEGDLFSSGIEWLKPVGRRLYFAAFHPLHGWEIWRSDGTARGTVRVTDFGFHNPFFGALQPWHLEEVGNRVVFLATDGFGDIKLWSSAGSRQSTTPLGEVCFDPDFCDFLPANWRLAKVGERVVFRGFDPAHGNEIWSTDGTPTGTRRLSDVCPGPCSSVTADPVVSGSVAWLPLVPSEREPGLELWRSDGTPQGTMRFARLDTASLNRDVTPAVAGNKIFFSAEDEYGLELWASDGTPEGTGPVDNITREPATSEPRELTPLGETLFFNVFRDEIFGNGDLYRTAGTAGTTAAVFESGPPEECRADRPAFSLTPASGKLFFARKGQLCVTDRTAGGSVQLTRLDADGTKLLGSVFVEHQGGLYFSVQNGGTGEIWRSDGTPAGTMKVLEIPEPPHFVGHLASLGSELYFTATVSGDLHAWRSDGTAAGTRRLTSTSISFFHDDKDPRFVRLGANVFFAGDTLWRTDGTPQGTAPVSDLSGFFGDQEITDLLAFEGALYFFARTPDRRRALWRSDGTENGTVILKSFEDPESFDPVPGFLTIFQGKLFFAADDGDHGSELWTGDGTAAGTALVRDIHPGEGSSQPSDLTIAGGRLFFAADDGLNGRELWESDGTAAGTRLRQDISPGAPPSSPQELTVAGSRLFFSADDGLTGRELWALPLGATGCQPSPTILCLAGGRFQVEAVWRDFENRTGAGQAVALTADTGYFWFFGPDNVEVVIKVLDGVGVNGHHWVFYGALSSVEYSITVTDTMTGAAQRYFNPTGRLGSVGDTEAFGPRGAFSHLAASQEAPPPAVTGGSTKAGPCVESATRLCLNGGRFAVEVSWKDFSGNTGTGQAVRLTGDTGYFWFFDDDNVELVLKVLDGRPANGKFWVFYGALSSVEYTITVTDTVTGTTKTYRNPSGRLASVADTGAF